MVELPKDDEAIQWLHEEAAGERDTLGVPAYVQPDRVNPPEGDRRHIAQAITFHPLAIKELVKKDFNLWSMEILGAVLDPDALEETKKQGGVPVDFLHSLSHPAAAFHEVRANYLYIGLLLCNATDNTT